jgi:glycosyltransferase involved in cell wall biosynthesis
MTPSRLLLLDHSAALGGAELYLLDVARAYRAHSSVLLFEDGPFADRLRDEQLDVECLQMPAALRDVRKDAGLGSALWAVPGLIRLVWQVARRGRHYDLLFANSQKSLLVGALVSILVRRPLVWNLHDLLTADHFTPLNRRIAVACANGAAAHVIANSQASLNAFRESGGRCPASVVYNGLDPTRFSETSPAQSRALRTELGVGDWPLVGIFSRLARWKGQHVLLEALSERPDLHALFVGDALFEGDEKYAAALHRTVEKNNLQDRVHFLGFRDDVPTLMRVCDVIAHTSTTPEPFGRVIVEGMFAERPVVATRAGGAAEILNDQATGLLVPPGDAAALGRALDTLLAAPDTAAEMGRAGAQAARRRFSLGRQLRGIAAVVEAVTGAPAP